MLRTINCKFFIKKDVFLLFICAFSIFSCQPSSENKDILKKEIVLCFEHYQPSSYHTRGDFHKNDYSLVMYANAEGQVVDFTPHFQKDTLIISCYDNFAEVALGYHTFEYAYFPLIQGDTAIITVDSLDYPIIHSKHYPERDEIYNANHKLRANYTIETLESGTVLGDADFHRLAINADILKKISPNHLYLSSYPVDSVKEVFENYVADYTRMMNGLLSEKKIDYDIFNYYISILNYKKEYAYFNERDTTYYQLLESRFSDDLVTYPSYHVFLDYYLQLYNQHIKSIQLSQGSYKNWKTTFDEIILKPIPTHTKHILLKKCMEPLAKYFDSEIVKEYLQKYRNETGDVQLFEEIEKQYNLTADKSQMFLHDMQGNQTNFQTLMEQYKGKVVYVDFWASWCAPCLAQMPASTNLRKDFIDKDVVFLYLAINDEEKNWQKASIEKGLSDLSTNFFIENAKSCDLLKELHVETIPRYLLFDKLGNLSNGDAPRPSSSQIGEEINQLLK